MLPPIGHNLAARATTDNDAKLSTVIDIVFFFSVCFDFAINVSIFSQMSHFVFANYL